MNGFFIRTESGTAIEVAGDKESKSVILKISMSDGDYERSEITLSIEDAKALGEEIRSIEYNWKPRRDIFALDDETSGPGKEVPNA